MLQANIIQEKAMLVHYDIHVRTFSSIFTSHSLSFLESLDASSSFSLDSSLIFWWTSFIAFSFANLEEMVYSDKL